MDNDYALLKEMRVRLMTKLRYRKANIKRKFFNAFKYRCLERGYEKNNE